MAQTGLQLGVETAVTISVWEPPRRRPGLGGWGEKEIRRGTLQKPPDPLKWERGLEPSPDRRPQG